MIFFHYPLKTLLGVAIFSTLAVGVISCKSKTVGPEEPAGSKIECGNYPTLNGRMDVFLNDYQELIKKPLVGGKIVGGYNPDIFTNDFFCNIRKDVAENRPLFEEKTIVGTNGLQTVRLKQSDTVKEEWMFVHPNGNGEFSIHYNYLERERLDVDYTLSFSKSGYLLLQK